MDYVPAFNRYPPVVVQAFGRIERARGAIESAELLPAQEDVLRRDAQVLFAPTDARRMTSQRGTTNSSPRTRITFRVDGTEISAATESSQ